MKNYLKLIIVLIFIFNFVNNIYVAKADCSPKNCPSNQKYPMKICHPPGGAGLPWKIECLTAVEINSSNFNFIPAIPNLPICLEFDESTFQGSNFVEVKGIYVFDIESAKADLEFAAWRWNCICPEQSKGPCQCKIKVIFSGADCDFAYIEKNTLAHVFNKIEYEMDGTSNMESCYINCENSHITINNSNDFMYGKSKPSQTDRPTTFFVTDDYAHNINAVNANNGIVYSFAEVIMHEIGHLLGFWHYDAKSVTILLMLTR